MFSAKWGFNISFPTTINHHRSHELPNLSDLYKTLALFVFIPILVNEIHFSSDNLIRPYQSNDTIKLLRIACSFCKHTSSVPLLIQFNVFLWWSGSSILTNEIYLDLVWKSETPQDYSDSNNPSINIIRYNYSSFHLDIDSHNLSYYLLFLLVSLYSILSLDGLLLL